jgi:N-acetylmuramoyl-L-alanine amidase
MTSYISTVNNNKFSAPRPEGTEVSTVVLTYSVSPTIHETVTKLYDNGASVHYTIRQDGFLDQHHNEDVKAFHSGKSAWHGKAGVNDYAIGVMLINDAQSQFPQEQINKLVSLLGDINTRHNKTMEIVGLGEVAPHKHIAPGNLFPWDKLADAGLVQQPTITASTECKLNLGDFKSITVINLQQRLIEHGYHLDTGVVFDQQTENVVNVFNSRYNQGQENSKCWSDASEEVMNALHPVTITHDEI